MWKLERGWTEVEVLRSKIQRERIPLNPTCAGDIKRRSRFSGQTRTTFSLCHTQLHRIKVNTGSSIYNLPHRKPTSHALHVVINLTIDQLLQHFS